MKFNKKIEFIKSNSFPKELSFIDYGKLKLEINKNNFLEDISGEIYLFDQKYVNLKKNSKYDTNLIIKYILLNYLTVNKLLKKMQKNNVSLLEEFKKNYKTIELYLKEYQFYRDILDIPEKFKYEVDDTCTICLDKCKIPIYTECNHVYCWNCLIRASSFKFDFCPKCKKNVIIDPAMIILNQFLNCDNKYSPFENCVLEKEENNIKLDIMSDLHIDQWSKEYENKYPCGEVKEYPLKIEKSDSEYLIVAGDISDSLDESLKYLNKLSNNYKKILFVDGNHEHVHKYPKLYDKKEIKKLINNDKLVYLADEPYRIDNILFIGSCGWWDYNESDKESKEKCVNYFDDWIPEFTLDENIEFIENVIKKSEEEYIYLKKNLEKYEKDNTIERIVIVTHTVPKKEYCNPSDGELLSSFVTEYNTKYRELLSCKKLTHWIFGHTHQEWEEKDNDCNIQFICNPRGRPEDFDRIRYQVKKLII